jgi:hypothetical protein
VPANQRWSQSRSGWRSGRRKRKAHLVRMEMSAGGTGIVDRRARRAVFLPSRRIASWVLGFLTDCSSTSHSPNALLDSRISTSSQAPNSLDTRHWTKTC